MHAQSPPRRAAFTARAAKNFFWRTVIAATVSTAAVVAPPYVVEFARELAPPPPHTILAYTVMIRVAKRGEDGALTWRGNGSGTVVFCGNDYSLILTNFHVPEGEDHILVIGYHYNEEGRVVGETYSVARVVRFSKEEDLALLRVEQRLPAVARLAQKLPRLSTGVISAGAQWGQSPFFTEGKLVRFLLPGKFHATAPILKGVSGGGYYAFVGGRYRLVGVPTWILGRSYKVNRLGPAIDVLAPHLGVGISIEVVREFLSGSPEFAHLREKAPP